MRSLSVLCRKPKFPAKGGGWPKASPHPAPPLRQMLFFNFNSYVCTSKIPTVREQLEQREWSLQHTLSFFPPLSRDPRGAFQVLLARTFKLQAGTLQFSVCAREERPVCTGAHWEAPGKEENYRATHAGPVTPVCLTRKANSSIRNS